MIDEVQYLQWISTDRATLHTVVQNTDEFIEKISRIIQSLKRGDFMVKQRSTFYSKRKETLKNSKVLVTGDFSENYLFLQDAIQGYHYNNAQMTVHPFVC